MSNTGLQNQLSESFFTTISAMANNAVSKSSNDRTIECEIVRIQDASKGIYTVQYTENKFTAIASNGLTYAVGDSVYVLVPEGNFSKNKIILGNTKAVRFHYQKGEEEEGGGGSSSQKEIIIQNKTYYDEITENLFVDISDIDLCTYHTEEKVVEYDNHYLSDIIKNYQIFVLKADFKTKIIDIAQRARGNYGLKLRIPAIDLDGEEFVVEKILDITKMEGNVYNFDNYITQSLYFDFVGSLIDPNKSITISAFVKDFVQSKDETIPADIFIKNIEFKAVNAITSEDLQGNYLTIEATEGYYFLNGKYDNDKTLTPKLRVNGEYVDVKEYECYWFKADSSVDSKHEYYNARGGIGWRLLNERTQTGTQEDGTPIYDYNLKNYNYIVKKSDIISAARYKCVLLNSNGEAHAIVTIANLNSEMTYSLTTPSGSTTFVKDVGVVNLIAKLHYPTSTDNTTFDYIFSRYDKNGNYIDSNFYNVIEWDNVSGYDRVTKISYPVGSIDEFNIVRCEFVRKRIQGNEIITESIGSASINLTTGSKVFDYFLSLSNHQYFYKYDANGNSPLVADFDGPYQSKMEEIQPVNVRIFKATGDELSSSEYSSTFMTWAFPKNSMMELQEYELETLDQDDNFYYVKGKGIMNLSYTIKDTYNNDLNDNSILITAVFDETTMMGSADFIFKKDGESGTNGSKYSVVIKHRITDEDGIDRWYAYGEKGKNGRPQKIRLVYLNDTWKRYLNNEYIDFGSPEFKVEVYKNGKLVENNAEENSPTYTASWEMFDPNYTNPFFGINSETATLTNEKNWTDANEVSVNILKVSVVVTESQDDVVGEEYVFGFYPIDIVRLDSTQKFIPEIAGGYSEVLYDSDGTNPHYNTNEEFSVNVVDGLNNYFTCIWDESSDTLIDEDTDSDITPFSKKYRPVSASSNGETFNYVKVSLTQTAENQGAVNAEATRLANLVTSLNNQINYLSNEENYLETFLNGFSYDTFVNRLEFCDNYLAYRGKYLAILFDLLSIIEQIQTVDENLDYSTEKTYLENIIHDIYNVTSSAYIEEYNVILESQGSPNAQAQSLINSFNTKVADAHYAYHNLMNYENLDSELEIYNEIIADTKKLITSIENLCSAHDGGEVNQDFVNIKNQIAIYAKYFEFAPKGYTKDWISENIFKPIENLLTVYRDNSYINTKYTTKIQELQQQLAQTNEQVAAADQSYFSHAIVIKPILFLLNRYGLSSINNWDGGKLYVDENGGYILAPQMGAGKKEEGQFTGVVMGVRGREGNNDDVGLFGYSKGNQSFFLDADSGVATFGLPNQGQIIMDPDPENHSSIAGWQIGVKDLGYEFDNLSVHLYAHDAEPVYHAPDPRTSSGYYSDVKYKAFEATNGENETYITYDGYFYSDNAYISGWIGAENGNIGGWKITGESLYTDDSGVYIAAGKTNANDNNTGFYLSEEALIIGDSETYLKYNSNGLSIKGTLEADSGRIGPFNINEDYIWTEYNEKINFILGEEGICLGGVGKFYLGEKYIGDEVIITDYTYQGGTIIHSNGGIQTDYLTIMHYGPIEKPTIRSESTGLYFDLAQGVYSSEEDSEEYPLQLRLVGCSVDNEIIPRSYIGLWSEGRVIIGAQDFGFKTVNHPNSFHARKVSVDGSIYVHEHFYCSFNESETVYKLKKKEIDGTIYAIFVEDGTYESTYGGDPRYPDGNEGGNTSTSADIITFDTSVLNDAGGE